MLLLETELLAFAREEVRRFRQKYIRCEHLLLALARLDSALDLDYATLSSEIAKLPYPMCGAEEKLELANGAQRALDAARKQIYDDKLDSQIVLQNILRYSPLARRIFDDVVGK